MLGSLEKLFLERVAPRIAQPSPEAREHGLRLAAAALLFEVVRADAEKDAHEEHLVRRIAGLLHVSHPDFIDAKIRARAESGLEKS